MQRNSIKSTRLFCPLCSVSLPPTPRVTGDRHVSSVRGALWADIPHRQAFQGAGGRGRVHEDPGQDPRCPHSVSCVEPELEQELRCVALLLRRRPDAFDASWPRAMACIAYASTPGPVDKLF